MPATASPGSRRTRLISGLSALTALGLTAGFLVATGGAAAAATACKVDYSVNQWSTGFTGSVTVTNLGDAIGNGWTVGWDFAGNQQVQQGWSATVTQSGQHVTAVSPDWAKSLATGASATFGFNAAYSGTNAAPASFTLNGDHLHGNRATHHDDDNNHHHDNDHDDRQPAATRNPRRQPLRRREGLREPGLVGRGAAARTTGGTLGSKMSKVANTSTAVWLDRIAAIDGTADQRGSAGPPGRGARAGHRRHPGRRPVRDLRPARPRLRGPGVQRRAPGHPGRAEQVQVPVHRPDRRDHGRPEVRQPAHREHRRDRTRCPTWSPTPRWPSARRPSPAAPTCRASSTR